MNKKWQQKALPAFDWLIDLMDKSFTSFNCRLIDWLMDYSFTSFNGRLIDWLIRGICALWSIDWLIDLAVDKSIRKSHISWTNKIGVISQKFYQHRTTKILKRRRVMIEVSKILLKKSSTCLEFTIFFMSDIFLRRKDKPAPSKLPWLWRNPKSSLSFPSTSCSAYSSRGSRLPRRESPRRKWRCHTRRPGPPAAGLRGTSPRTCPPPPHWTRRRGNPRRPEKNYPKSTPERRPNFAWRNNA